MSPCGALRRWRPARRTRMVRRRGHQKGSVAEYGGNGGMKAADVMVSPVITVGPECLVQDVAATLLENRISAVLVVSNGGDVVGIVSEGDLIRRPEIDTEQRRA